MKKRTGIFFGIITFCMLGTVFLQDPTCVILNQEILEKPSPPIEYLPPAINLPDNSKVLQGLGEQYSMNIASASSINSTYEPTFIVRMENGNIFYMNATEINTYSGSQYSNIWGIGIRTRYGIVGFYSNDQDPTWGHTQLITYPVFNNGSLPPLNKPIMGTFLRLWVRTGGTWYRNFITSQPLFQANDIDPRRWMKAEETSDILELGWNATLELQGYNFDLYVGIQLNKTHSHNEINIKTNITSLDRNWDGLGLEYVLAQSSFWDGTDEQIFYGTVETDLETQVFPLSEFKDVTIEIPSRFNRTQLLTRSHRPVHTFDWDDLQQVGFDTSLFRIENMELPNGEYDWVIRTGMYGLRNIPQGYTIEIDPSITVTSDATRAIPKKVVRDSSNIPYVLAIVGTTLKAYKGNDTSTPLSWTEETVGDGNVESEKLGYCDMITYSYSGTEYIGIIRINDDLELVFDRSTVGSFAFPSGSTQILDDTALCYFPSIGYGEDRLVVHYRYGYEENANIKHSTNGGASWSSAVETWDEVSGSVNFLSSGVTWDGSYWHLLLVVDETPYTKRWSIGGGVEYWDGDSWESAGDGDLGLTTGFNNQKYGGAHGAASANIIVFSHMADGTNYGRCMFSLDGGESWAETPNMDHNDYIGFPSFSLKTEAGEVDDLLVFASNYSSGQNSVDFNLYDYSESTWGGWTLIWDSGDPDDTVCYFAGLLDQQDGWVDYAFQHYDDSESTYYLNFTIYETGSAGGDETAPSFSYVGTTNSSSVELGTNPIANWSITEANPSIYIIYSNETGTGNVSRASGSYNNGDYKSRTYTNTNVSNVGKTLFFQIWANDTSQNANSSIVYFDIVDTTGPVFNYVGTTNNTSIEYGTAITFNASITELAPDYYYIWANTTGSNATKVSGSFSNGDYKSWTFINDIPGLVGDTIFIQSRANDTTGNSDSIITYFTIVDTTDPVFNYVGTTNNTSIEYGTSITSNTSITDLFPDTYLIYSNTTGSNVTKASDSFLSGNYYSWTFDNNLVARIGDIIFIQTKANDTSGNMDSIITYFTIVDTTDPVFNYVGTTNNTSIDIGTAITFNVSITELAPDYYYIWANTTGSNATKVSGSFSNGDYKSWEFSNNDCSITGDVIFIQMRANDTTGNSDSIITYFTINNDAPQLSYSGTANNTAIEWEIGGSFTVSWTITEDNPHLYILYWNQTSSNTTWASGTYTSSLSKGYNPVLGDIGNVIWIQVVLNDTCSASTTETYFLSVTNTAPPTITITRPEATTYLTTLIEIWISSSNEDSDSLWWALHYANGTLYEGNVTYTESTSRTLPEASYIFKGYGNDTSGNEGISTVEFAVSEAGVALGGPSSPRSEDTIEIPEPLGKPQPYLTQGFTVILVGLAIGSVWWVSENWTPEPTWNQVKQRKKFRKQMNQLKRYFNEQMKK